MVRCRTPDDTGNHFFSPLTESKGSAAVQARVREGAWAAVSGIWQLSPRLGHPASGELSVTDPVQQRDVTRASRDRKGAPRMKRASGWEMDEVGGQALDRLQRF